MSSGGPKIVTIAPGCYVNYKVDMTIVRLRETRQTSSYRTSIYTGQYAGRDATSGTAHIGFIPHTSEVQLSTREYNGIINTKWQSKMSMT